MQVTVVRCQSRKRASTNVHLCWQQSFGNGIGGEEEAAGG